MEHMDWHDKNDRRHLAGLLLLTGDLVERRTEGCEDNKEWRFWGEIEAYIESIILSLTPAEIELLEALEASRERFNIHVAKAEPMKTVVLYDLLKVSESDLIEMKEDIDLRKERFGNNEEA